ncbi:MAG: CotH kinase family protein [Candidatus Eisenbacteria bacterium]|nr:CotH kinase family protein [Candidatus Eisenbacteria bacterium]
MKQTIFGAVLCWLTLASSSALGALSPPSHPLFEGDAVHEISLTFHQPGWWDSLTANFEVPGDPLYLAAEFDWGGVHFDSIGVRFKGHSSYSSYPGVKKPLMLDINEFVEGQEISGLDKLNLNNAFLDPTFVRERCCYELCEALGLPTVRTNFAALHINGEYWGLYVLVEQLDQEFIESRFGSGEAGNLWMGEPHGSFTYRGNEQAAYYQEYELESNEEENDWSALVEVVDGLNNTPVYARPAAISPLMDVNSALAMLAIDNFVVNLDSYIGRCGNFYFYHRDRDSRVVFAKWDVNEAWGLFNMANMSASQLRELDPFWTNPMPGEGRPLATQLWQVDTYRELYLGHMRRLMAGAAQPDTLIARMNLLRDMIRPFVYADENKMFSDTDFDASMTADVVFGGGPHPRTIPALEPFIRIRDAWLSQQIGTWTGRGTVVLNELMADNQTTVADDQGDYDDWVEIANVGSGAVNLEGLALTDDVGDTTCHFVFPDLVLDPGQYVVVWADNEPEEGPLHAPFKLDDAGEEVYLLDAWVVSDQVAYPELGGDVSWGRWPDGTGAWRLVSLPTPGAENQNPVNPEEIALFINEFLADNESVSQDEMGEYEDWVEIFNPGTEPVPLGGLFLTDDLSATTKWAFPETTVAPGGFLVIWCDGEDDGPLHAAFKLDADGEELGLFGRISAGNTLIDSHLFGAQAPDISEGRRPDGSETWVGFSWGSRCRHPGPPTMTPPRRMGRFPPATPCFPPTPIPSPTPPRSPSSPPCRGGFAWGYTRPRGRGSPPSPTRSLRPGPPARSGTDAARMAAGSARESTCCAWRLGSSPQRDGWLSCDRDGRRLAMGCR